MWTHGIGTFSDCTFRENQATGRGGAVYTEKLFQRLGARILCYEPKIIE